MCAPEILQLLFAQRPELTAEAAASVVELVPDKRGARRHLLGCRHASAAGIPCPVPLALAVADLGRGCSCADPQVLCRAVPAQPELVAAILCRWAQIRLQGHLARLTGCDERPQFVAVPALLADLDHAARLTDLPSPAGTAGGTAGLWRVERTDLADALERARAVDPVRVQLAAASMVASQLKVVMPPGALRRDVAVFLPAGRRWGHTRSWSIAATVWGVAPGVLWLPGWVWPWLERKAPTVAHPTPATGQLVTAVGGLAVSAVRPRRIVLARTDDAQLVRLAGEVRARNPALDPHAALAGCAAALT